ncbi:MAG TPA: FAD-dependent oxidoreductase [Opitutaceae bacterium]
MNTRNHYEVAIIGAGLSGLAAGIRAAHFGRSVCIFERHNAAGGLNGFYSLDNRKFDVGLHAVTNYVPPGVRGTPLTKLLRQLRIERDELGLREQIGSAVAFGANGGARLRFDNRIELLESEVARVFPAEVDGFRRLAQCVRATPFDPDGPAISTREIFSRHLREPLLREMLLCPLMFYGSAHERDFPFSQGAMMFQALYLEGFARPAEGVRRLMRVLLEKYRAAGGERRMKCGVRSIRTEGTRAVALILDDGTEVTADRILSSIGGPETMALFSAPPSSVPDPGLVTYVETMSVLDREPRDLGWGETIVFFNEGTEFHYEQPRDAVDTRSGVICVPNNFQFSAEERPPEGLLRITCLADYDAWANASETDYAAMKRAWFSRVQASARRFLAPVADADLAAATRATDMFTPRTIQKFTGHRNGAIYGSPDKRLRGDIGLSNLHLCGTDQGLLGIVGSMLSGIMMANLHLFN